MDLGSTNKTYINVSTEFLLDYFFIMISLNVGYETFFLAFFRKVLLNHNTTMSFSRKIPSSLVTAGMLVKNIAVFLLSIVNHYRSLFNQSLLVCVHWFC